MITCKTCRFWRHIRDEDYLVKSSMGNVLELWKGPHGECGAIGAQFDEPAKAWLSTSVSIDDPKQPSHTGTIDLTYNLTTHLDESLITQPDFGCTLGEPRG